MSSGDACPELQHFFYLSAMEKLVIKGTAVTPEIVGNPESGTISISGRSIPENATSFYKPVLDWVENYKLQPQDKTELTFFLDYVNSISQKVLYEILDRLSDLSKSSQLKVYWKYEADDEEILDEGKVFQTKFDVDFQLVPVNEE